MPGWGPEIVKMPGKKQWLLRVSRREIWGGRKSTPPWVFLSSLRDGCLYLPYASEVWYPFSKSVFLFPAAPGVLMVSRPPPVGCGGRGRAQHPFFSFAPPRLVSRVKVKGVTEGAGRDSTMSRLAKAKTMALALLLFHLSIVSLNLGDFCTLKK